jgi:hypothetical protein
MYLQWFLTTSSPFDTFRTTMCAAWRNSEYVSIRSCASMYACLHAQPVLTTRAWRSAQSERLVATWSTAMFQRDFMRYIATMRLSYDRTMQCRKCTEEGGPRYVTMDGTATSIQRVRAMTDPLKAADGPPKPSSDVCVFACFSRYKLPLTAWVQVVQSDVSFQNRGHHRSTTADSCIRVRRWYRRNRICQAAALDGNASFQRAGAIGGGARSNCLRNP